MLLKTRITLLTKHCFILNSSECENMLVVRSDLNYGQHSYFARYLTQCYMINYEFADFDKYKFHRYRPLHYKELRDKVNQLLEGDCSTLFGKKYIAEGAKDLSVAELANLIQVNFEDNSKQIQRPSTLINGISKGASLFFYGNNHRINMELMLENMKNNNPNFEGFAKLGKAIESPTDSDVFHYYTHLKKDAIEERTGQVDVTYEEPLLYRYWRATLD